MIPIVVAGRRNLWPENNRGVVAVADERWDERGLGESMAPRIMRAVDGMPLLGSGKTGYVAVQKIAKAGEGSPAAG